MRINAINAGFSPNNKNKTSFKRVIPVEYESSLKAQWAKGVDYSLTVFSDVLNSKRTNIYSPKEAEKIREFFRQKIDDYDGKSGVMFVKAKDRVFLLSGEDAEKIGALKEETAKKVQEIENGSKPGAEKNKAVSDLRTRYNNTIIGKSESGRAAKPVSGLVFNRKDRNRLKIDSVSYFYEYFNTGRPEKYYHIPSGKAFDIYNTAIYDEGTLEI